MSDVLHRATQKPGKSLLAKQLKLGQMKHTAVKVVFTV